MATGNQQITGRESDAGGGQHYSTGADKKITPTNTISDADIKTPDAIETRSPRNTDNVGRINTPQTGATYRERQQGAAGATEGSDISRQHPSGKPTNRKVEGGKVIHEGSKEGLTIGARRKLTPQGKPSNTKDVKNPAFVASGREASYDSGITSGERRTGKPKEGGKGKINPEKKVKAEMELAIIKSKLLKMKSKGFGGSEHKYGTENTGSAGVDDDPKPTPNNQSVKDPPTSQAKDRADESVTSYGEGASGNQHGGKTTHGEAGDKQLNVEGNIGRDVGDEDIKSRASTKSDEIVEKAIELINEAYDEMKSDGFKKLKPTYEGDTKQAKKDAPSTTSSEGSANFVYSDVKEAEKQKQ